jgi:hypothetical protein
VLGDALVITAEQVFATDCTRGHAELTDAEADEEGSGDGFQAAALTRLGSQVSVVRKRRFIRKEALSTCLIPPARLPQSS